MFTCNNYKFKTEEQKNRRFKLLSIAAYVLLSKNKNNIVIQPFRFHF